MPDPAWVPAVLREADAAHYCGLSPTTFRAVVAPQVTARRLSTGRVGWLRADLDAWIAALPPVDAAAPPAAPSPATTQDTADARGCPIATALAALPRARAKGNANQAR
jgi:predicted DNA-binding transcriptional regulator AlpA